MGGVEDHRRAGGAREDRQRAHVVDERIVAEGYAALGHQHVAIAHTGDFVDDVGHVPGRQELALLDIDHPAGRRRRIKVGLSAQEGRNLQHVDHLRDAGALRDFVHVGENGHPEPLRISAKIGNASSNPMPRLLRALVRFALSNEVL